MTEIERICLAALDRPAEERAAFLDEACHGDVALRLEVESLLAHASPAEHFIEHPAVAGAGALAGLSGLSIGQRLGPYHIVAKLGVGGMGEVYRARDTQLGREVAIKILPVIFATDPDRLARFEREARILASLNHPHIAAIYGVEADPADDGVPRRALVMELIEGPTLAERLRRGPLSMAEALPVARQIAEALEAAHEQGIIHRDLKPANVKVRPDGTVKVLDFGLAKEMEPSGAAVDATLSPTITTPAMTQAGVILGTAAYMSPEQVQGKSVGRRSDVWAFGCVMYEMLTGRLPFPSGETVADTLASVLTREPDWDALPATTPPAVRSLIRRCLRKDVRRRLPDIAEARIELEDAAGEPTPASPPVSAPLSRRRERLWAAVAIVSLLTAAAFGAWITLIPKPDVRVYNVHPPLGVTLINPVDPNTLGGSVGEPLSPDGRTLAFRGFERGLAQIWVHRLDSGSARLLEGTENATRPAWSPDSRSLVFVAGDKVKTVRVDGGKSVPICDAQSQRDVAWGAGVILLGGRGPLLRVPADGGQVVPATKLGPDEIAHSYPEFFPDGRRFLYMVRYRTTDRRDVYVGSLDSTEHRRLDGIHLAARISSTGHILFALDGTLMAQRIDLDTLGLKEEPFPVAGGAYQGANPPFSMSTNGSLAYLGQARTGESHLVWVDGKGIQGAEAGPPGDYRNLAVSRDAKYAAFDRFGPNRDVWVLDLERGGSAVKQTTDGADAMPVFSPNSRSIGYLSSRVPAGGVGSRGNLTEGNLFQRGLGAATDTELLKTNAGKVLTDWGNEYLAFISRDDVWLLDPSSGHSEEPIQITNTPPSRESDAKISPKGRLIAYESESDGQREVYVQSFRQPGASPRKVSTHGGIVPRWSPDGTKLFYIAPDLALMSVSIAESGETGLKLGPQKKLFQTPLKTTQGRDYDVAADGRFLFNVPTAEPPPVTITVILNWLEILKARRLGF